MSELSGTGGIRVTKPASNSGGGCGCFSTILFVFTMWALINGVTINGKHYGFSGCDCEHGVKVDR